MFAKILRCVDYFQLYPQCLGVWSKNQSFYFLINILQLDWPADSLCSSRQASLSIVTNDFFFIIK